MAYPSGWKNVGKIIQDLRRTRIRIGGKTLDSIVLVANLIRSLFLIIETNRWSKVPCHF
jgi:hypothetical protein